MGNTYNDYGMEMRLKELSLSMHKRFTDMVFATQNLSFRYKSYFPEYNDHSNLHSMGVIDLCNQLIGREEILRLNRHELYILLVSCYLHDLGMGISREEYDEFGKVIDFGDYFETYRNPSPIRVIRDFHHEFSALFIKKYKDFLELPSLEHTFAVMQVVRGHRQTDLFDVKEFPSDFRLSDGSSVCLPYLAALIRLADEIDVTSLRSSKLLFDVDNFESREQVLYYQRTRACEKIEVTEDAIVMYVRTDRPEVADALEKMQQKMQETLELCAEVVEKRTPYSITQRRVEMIWREN